MGLVRKGLFQLVGDSQRAGGASLSGGKTEHSKLMDRLRDALRSRHRSSNGMLCGLQNETGMSHRGQSNYSLDSRR